MMAEFLQIRLAVLSRPPGAVNQFITNVFAELTLRKRIQTAPHSLIFHVLTRILGFGSPFITVLLELHRSRAAPILAPIVSTADRNGSAAKCAYRIVVTGCL